MKVRLAPSDERPVAPWARGAFYLSLLLLMHTEFSFGRGAKFVPVLWPFHESELALSAALHWCHAPRAMLRLDGALGVADRLARALLPRAACGAAARGVGAATSAALLLSAGICATTGLDDRWRAIVPNLPVTALVMLVLSLALGPPAIDYTVLICLATLAAERWADFRSRRAGLKRN